MIDSKCQMLYLILYFNTVVVLLEEAAISSAHITTIVQRHVADGSRIMMSNIRSLERFATSVVRFTQARVKAGQGVGDKARSSNDIVGIE